jgi:aprataxin
MFHFLVMPRLLPSMETAKYRNLRSLLQWDRTKAKETILKLQEDSKQIVSDVEEEMIRLHGFKWKVQFVDHLCPLVRSH